MAKTFLILTACSSLCGVAIAQPATPAQRAGLTDTIGYGTMHFQTRLGSFKIIDGRGRVEFDFKGSFLVSQLKGQVSLTGNIRKEYEKHGRVIYNGQGRAVVTGEWRAIQWFGRDLTGVWFGRGRIRIGGEFDRNQKTGEYWFDDPARINYWPSGSTYDIDNPESRAGYNPGVRIKKKG